MKPLIVANWKANKSIKETVAWVNKTKPELEAATNVGIVVCPPLTSIPAIALLLNDSVVKIGAQNVSNHPDGAFTGEVTAQMLSGLVNYCIVGHSERRRYFAETEDQVDQKIGMLLNYKITPIVCIGNLVQLDNYLKISNNLLKNAKEIVFVYEPPDAISGGGDYHPESPENAANNATKINEKIGEPVFTLYGGSVSENDVDSFLEAKNINGVLVGKASLNAQTFISLIKKANSAVI